MEAAESCPFSTSEKVRDRRTKRHAAGDVQRFPVSIDAAFPEVTELRHFPALENSMAFE
jgi:hypothetical protein